MKHYYAMYDATVSPDNPGKGFCNTKHAMAFRNKADRDEFVNRRKWYDLSCEAISYKTALSMAYVPFGCGRSLAVKSYDSDYPHIMVQRD